MSWNETKKCPVCNKKLLTVGMINHIIGTAKSELYEWYFRRKTEKPHLVFVTKNTEIKKIKRIKLKYEKN